MMIPVKVAGVSPAFVSRVSARACQMQGLPEVHYALHPADQRVKLERGAYNMLAALESLGCVLMAPAELSPILPHDREVDPLLPPEP